MIRSRRESIWIIDDVSGKENEDKNGTNSAEIHDQQHQQSQTALQQPRKIGTRRQSARLLHKRMANDNENDEELHNTQSESIPPKRTKREQPMADKSVQPASSSASIPNVRDQIILKTKNELSKAIFGLFEDFQQDQKFANRYTAQCTVCDEKENARLSFYKGINSNLKSHLERVSKLYFRFCFRSLYFLVFHCLVK